MSSESSAPAPYRVVVGVDFTESSDVAFAEALRIAGGGRNGELHVATVLPKDGGLRQQGLEKLADAIDAAYQRLREYVVDRGPRFADARFSQDVHYHVRLGEAPEALAQVGVDVDADLLIVGTHSRRGLERLMLGSVAEKLVRDARVPVLVARAKDLAGAKKTPGIEAPRPGEDIHHHRDDMHYSSEHLTFERRSTHVSGLF